MDVQLSKPDSLSYRPNQVLATDVTKNIFRGHAQAKNQTSEWKWGGESFLARIPQLIGFDVE